ncbi:MAG: hypothetical protein VB127_09245 [Sphaerochaeta sp.]|nr:hypothetical protein [Sphaerochaeta sp.]
MGKHQVKEATLFGVTTEEMWVDADGGVWVLCSIPLASIESSFGPAAAAVFPQVVPPMLGVPR